MLIRDESASNVTVAKAVACMNALLPMLVTLAGMIMEVKLNAEWNANSPILLRDESVSNVIVVKAVAPWNALLPMLVTLDGMVMEVKPVADWNA